MRTLSEDHPKNLPVAVSGFGSHSAAAVAAAAAVAVRQPASTSGPPGSAGSFAAACRHRAPE